MTLPENFMGIALHVCAALSLVMTVVTFRSGRYKTDSGRRTLFLTILYLGFYVYLVTK
jgi:hypothetical protein